MDSLIANSNHLSQIDIDLRVLKVIYNKMETTFKQYLEMEGTLTGEKKSMVELVEEEGHRKIETNVKKYLELLQVILQIK